MLVKKQKDLFYYLMDHQEQEKLPLLNLLPNHSKEQVDLYHVLVFKIHHSLKDIEELMLILCQEYL